MRKKENNAVFADELNHNIFEIKDVQNPAELMEKALSDVSKAFETLYDNYNMSYDEFYKYIQFHNDRLSREIDELWDSINCNIYDHYEQGVLLSFELKSWKEDLIEWQEKIIAAVRDFIKDEFHDRFRPGESAPVYVEAA